MRKYASTCFLLISTICGVAGAEPGADKAAAQALFDEGKRLATEGHYAEGCPKLAESQRLDPAPGTLLNLADCYEKAGLTASAWATWLEAASATKQAGQLERERLARKRADALKPRLMNLEISVPEASRFPGLEVRRDNTVVSNVVWGTPMPIDPGTHGISARASGHRSWNTTVVVVQGVQPSRVVIPRLEPEAKGAVAPAGAVPQTPAAISAAPATAPPTAQPGAQPQAAPPSGLQASAQPQIQLVPQTSAPAQPQQTAEDGPMIRTVSFIARIGLQGSGSGKDKIDCNGDVADCGTTPSQSTDMTFGGAPAISIGAMFKIGKLFRIGPEVFHTFKTGITTNPAWTIGDFSAAITDIDVVAELVPRVSRAVWLVPRVQLGAAIFNYSGGMADWEKNQKTACQDGGFNGCDTITSPHLGGHIGFGFGAMFAAGDRIRIRVDGLLDVLAVETQNASGTTTNGSVTITENLVATRGLLFAGLEI
jgi:hypothetical protein